MSQDDHRTINVERRAHPSRRGRGRVALAAALVLGLGVAGCGSDDSSGDEAKAPAGSTSTAVADLPGKDVSDADLQQAIRRAFFADVPVDEIDPVMVSALRVAAQPLTPEQQAKLAECIGKAECDTGRGDLVVGIADPFGGIPWRQQARVEATAQALAYPQVRKIIYTDGNANQQQSLANFRSLMSRDVDVIVGYFDFASSMLNLIKQAHQRGISVVPYIGPVPGARGGTDIATQVLPDLCAAGTNMAKRAVDAGGEHKAAALFTGIPGNASTPWQDCAKKELESNGWKVAHQGNTKWTPQGEISAGSELISTGKPVDAILYDNTGANFFVPYKRAKRPVPVIISWANSNQYYKAWKALPKGSRPNFIINGQTWTPRPAVTAGIERELGNEVSDQIVLPQPIVDTADAMTYVEDTLDLPDGYAPATFAPIDIVKQALGAK
ncbi:MAG: substrate-binding domain-containing protein [Solirubrobacteraceae bacterium]